MWLSGRVEDLTIRLSSEPPMPQEDLLALVTLGSTRAELGSSGGLTFAGEAAQLMTRELLGLEPSETLVDVLESGIGSASQFSVGERIGDKTTIIYTGSFAEGGQQKLRVEYQIIGPLLRRASSPSPGGRRRCDRAPALSMIVLLLVALAVTTPIVTGVEVTSSHLLPSPPPDQFLTDLVGQPLSRDRVRASLDRLWALGVFDSVQVEEIESPAVSVFGIA